MYALGQGSLTSQNVGCSRRRKGKTMKKLGVCSVLSIFAFCALLSLSPRKAYADTVTLQYQGSSSTVSGTGDLASYIYPYNFTVNGSESTAPLMCLDFANDIEPGDSWQANVGPVTIADHGTTFSNEEAAYLFSQIGKDGTVDVQWAVWKLLDPTDLSDSELTANGLSATSIDALVTGASTFVTNNPNSPIYSQFVIYSAVDGSGVTAFPGDSPQDLIGFAPAPEPSSLVLLGSGLLFAAAFFYWRRRNTSSQAPEGSLS
jgi:hypothetical protein